MVTRSMRKGTVSSNIQAKLAFNKVGFTQGLPKANNIYKLNLR